MCVCACARRGGEKKLVAFSLLVGRGRAGLVLLMKGGKRRSLFCVFLARGTREAQGRPGHQDETKKEMVRGAFEFFWEGGSIGAARRLDEEGKKKENRNVNGEKTQTKDQKKPWQSGVRMEDGATKCEYDKPDVREKTDETVCEKESPGLCGDD